MRFKSFRRSSIIMRKISVSVQKNHNIDVYLAKALQDFLNGKTSDNDEYEDLVDLESYIGITTVKNLLDE